MALNYNNCISKSRYYIIDLEIVTNDLIAHNVSKDVKVFIVPHLQVEETSTE